jgi:hypothetical protein
LTESLSTIFAPLIGGVLLGLTGISGILLIDIISFSAALITLSIVFIPQPDASTANQEGKGSLLQEAAYGFRYIFRRPSLLGLQLIFFFGNLLASMITPLFSFMILLRTNYDKLALASVQSAFGVGAVIGGLTLAAWGGLKRRVHGVLAGWFLSAVFGSIALGLARTVPVWIIFAFLSSLIGIYINASNQAIWQTKVSPELQGRVFSARLLIAQIVGPVGAFLGGPLADKILEPAMRDGGSLAPALGWLVGTGPGAGMALLMIISGVLMAIVGLSGYLFPAIRNAEDILPDHDAKIAEPVENEAVVEVPATVS